MFRNLRNAVTVNKVASILSNETRTIEDIEFLYKFLSQCEDFNKSTSKISRLEKMQLLKSLTCKFFSAGQVIFSKGDPVQNLFIVLRGSVEHYTSEKGVKMKTIYSTGKQIGDKSYMRQPTRTSSCVSITDSILLSISIEVYRDLLGDNAHMLIHKKIKFVDQYFPGIKRYSFSHRERIAHIFEVHLMKKGSTVHYQGELSDIIFFLCSGEVELKSDNCNEPILRITPGSCIGEEVLLDVECRYTSVIASDKAILYSIKKGEAVQYVPDETREAWKRNYLLKEKERKRLDWNMGVRVSFLEGKRKSFEFSMASPNAKKMLSLVTQRYSMSSSHKELVGTIAFENSKRILVGLRDHGRAKRPNTVQKVLFGCSNSNSLEKLF